MCNERVVFEGSTENAKLNGVLVGEVDAGIATGVSALLGVVQELFWLVLIAITGRPLVELVLRSAGKLQKLLPVLFKEEQDSGNHGVLLCFRLTKSIAVDMNMKSAGARLMARVTHLYGLLQDGCPRHF